MTCDHQLLSVTCDHQVWNARAWMQLTDNRSGLLFWYNQVRMLGVVTDSFDLCACCCRVCIVCDAAHCS